MTTNWEAGSIVGHSTIQQSTKIQDQKLNFIDLADEQQFLMLEMNLMMGSHPPVLALLEVPLTYKPRNPKTQKSQEAASPEW